MGDLWRKLQYLLHRKQMQRELEEEMAAHRAEMRDPRAFGSALKLREEANDSWGFGWLERLTQDLRYAVRLLRKSPGFTLTAIGVLAFGIGLNVAAFGLLNTAMFRPLPGIEDPHTVMRLTRRSKENNSSNVSYPSYDFYRRNNKAFSSLFAISGAELTFGDNERWRAKFVTPNLFSELGVRAAYGRIATAEPGDVVISSAFFERRFGSDPSILNKSLLLNRRAARIIGVVSAEFQGLDPGNTDVWPIIDDHPHFFEGSRLLTDYEMQPLHLYGRLARGVSPKAAEDAMRPVVNARREIAPKEVWEGEYLYIEPGAFVLTNTKKLIGPMLFAGTLLMLVLATACANLGNLLLARGLTRERELSIRAAIGANRGRIVRQLMTESLLLAILGAIAGLILSSITIQAAIRILDWPAFIAVAPDWRVIAFAFASAILASLLFGLAPALQATRTNAKRASRLRLALIATQAAASCILLILSGLLTRGIQKAADTSPGFAYEESAVIDPDLAGVGREGKSAQLYMDELRSRIAQVAGVESTAYATIPPLGDRSSTTTTPQGRMHVNTVDSAYFDTMRIPILRGRTFQKGERDVMILGERAALKLFPNSDPVGKEYASKDGKTRWTIVGVAANAPITSPGDPDAMEGYHPMEEGNLSAVLLIRTNKFNDVAKTLQQTANGVDSRVIPSIAPMRQGLARRIENTRAGALAVTALGTVSLALAVIGFAGLISFAVTRRTREIGVRLALGATRWEVMRIGLDRVLLPTAIGLGIGMAGAAGLANVLRSQLFGLSSLDPVSFGLAPVLFLGFALLLSLGPLGRAARVDPATALRHE